MSPDVRRMLPRPMRPVPGQGPPTEAVAVEEPPADEDGPAFDVQPDGRITPRFRRFAPGIAPPPPSPHYRRDAGYAAKVDVASVTIRQAMANHRRWEERH